MKSKILKALNSAKKDYPKLKHVQFTIKEKRTKHPIKIVPTINSFFQKKHKRKYKIIIPKHKKEILNKLSQKEIEFKLKNELAFVLESQSLLAIQLIGFTLQYLLNKKSPSQK